MSEENFYSIKEFANLIREQDSFYKDVEDDWAVSEYIRLNKPEVTKAYVSPESLDSLTTKYGKFGLSEVLGSQVPVDEAVAGEDTPEESETPLPSLSPEEGPGTGVQISGAGPVAFDFGKEAPSIPLDLAFKSLAIGTANTLASPVQKLGQVIRAASGNKKFGKIDKTLLPTTEDWQTSPWQAWAKSQDAINQRKIDFNSLETDEQEAVLEKNAVEGFANVIREAVPDEWEDQISQYEINAEDAGESAKAIALGAFQTAPLVATQWGLSAIPVAGKPLAIGSMMSIEAGSLLNMSDRMADAFEAKLMSMDENTREPLEEGKTRELSEEEERMVNQFRFLMEQSSGMYGILSGTVEFSGNFLGHMGGFVKLAGPSKTLAGKIFKELGGIMLEGGEELAQFSIQERFMKSAIEKVARDHGNDEFRALWSGSEGWKEFVLGAGVSAILRGSRVGSQRLLNSVRENGTEQQVADKTLTPKDAEILEEAINLVNESKQSELTDEQQRVLNENQLSMFYMEGEAPIQEDVSQLKEESETLNKEVEDRGLVGKNVTDLTADELALLQRVREVQDRIEGQPEKGVPITPGEEGKTGGVQAVIDESKKQETPDKPQQTIEAEAEQESTIDDVVENKAVEQGKEELTDEEIEAITEEIEAAGHEVVNETDASPTLNQLRDDFVESAGNYGTATEEDRQGIIEERDALRDIYNEENPGKTDAQFNTWVKEGASQTGKSEDFTVATTQAVGDGSVEVVSKEIQTKSGKKRKKWEVHLVNKDGVRTTKVSTPTKKLAMQAAAETLQFGEEVTEKEVAGLEELISSAQNDVVALGKRMDNEKLSKAERAKAKLQFGAASDKLNRLEQQLKTKGVEEKKAREKPEVVFTQTEDLTLNRQEAGRNLRAAKQELKDLQKKKAPKKEIGQARLKVNTLQDKFNRASMSEDKGVEPPVKQAKTPKKAIAPVSKKGVPSKVKQKLKKLAPPKKQPSLKEKEKAKAKIQKLVPPKKKSVVARGVEAVEKKATNVADFAKTQKEAALERIKNRRGNKLYSGIPLSQLQDEVIYGASQVIEAGANFTKWSAQMVKQFGEGIRPHLKRIFKGAQKQATNWKRDIAKQTVAAKKAVMKPQEDLKTRLTRKKKEGKVVSETLRGKGRINAIDYTVEFNNDEPGRVTFSVDGIKSTKSIGPKSIGKGAIQSQITEKINKALERSAEEPAFAEPEVQPEPTQERGVKKKKSVVFPSKAKRRRKRKPPPSLEERVVSTVKALQAKQAEIKGTRGGKRQEIQAEIDSLTERATALREEVVEQERKPKIFSKFIGNTFQREVDRAHGIVDLQIKTSSKDESRALKARKKAITPLKSDSEEMLGARRRLVKGIVANSEINKRKLRIGKKSGAIGRVRAGEYQGLSVDRMTDAAHEIEKQSLKQIQYVNDLQKQILSNELKPVKKYEKPSKTELLNWDEEDVELLSHLQEAILESNIDGERLALLNELNNLVDKYSHGLSADETPILNKVESIQPSQEELEDGMEETIAGASDTDLATIVNDVIGTDNLTSEEIGIVGEVNKTIAKEEKQDVVDISDVEALRLAGMQKTKKGYQPIFNKVIDILKFDTKKGRFISLRGSLLHDALNNAGFSIEETQDIIKTPTNQTAKKALIGFIHFDGKYQPAADDLLTLQNTRLRNQRSKVAEAKIIAANEKASFNQNKHRLSGQQLEDAQKELLRAQRNHSNAIINENVLEDFSKRLKLQNDKWNKTGKNVYVAPVIKTADDYRRATAYSGRFYRQTPKMFSNEVDALRDRIKSERREFIRLQKSKYLNDADIAVRSTKQVSKIAFLNSTLQTMIAQQDVNNNSGKDVPSLKHDATINKSVLETLSPELQENIEIKRSQLEKGEDGRVDVVGGKVVVRIASDLNAQEYRQALIHELIGHHGASAVLASDENLSRQIDGLWENNREGAAARQILASAKDTDTFGGHLNPNRLNSEQERILKEEWIALEMEGVDVEIAGKKRGFGQRIRSSIKNFLQSMGVRGSYLNDVLDDMIVEMGVTHEGRYTTEGPRYALSDRANFDEARKTVLKNYSKEEVVALTEEMRNLVQKRKGLRGNQLIERAQINIELQKKRGFRKELVQQLIYNYAKKANIQVSDNEIIKLRGQGFNRVDTLIKKAGKSGTVRDFEKAMEVMDNVIEKKGQRQLVKRVESVMKKEFDRIKQVQKGKKKGKLGDQALLDYMSQFYYLSENKDERLKETYNFFHDHPNETIPEKLLVEFPKVFNQNLRTMTSSELIDVLNSLKDAKKLQTLKNRLTRQGQIKEQQQVVNDMIKSLKKQVSSKEDPIDRATNQRKLRLQREGSIGAKALEKTVGPPLKRGGRIVSEIFQGMWKPETIIKHLDGWKKGKLYNGIWKPMWESNQAEEVAIEAAQKKIKSLIDDNDVDFFPADTKIFDDFTFGVEGVDGEVVETRLPLTLNNMMHIYGHAKNPQSLRHLKATNVLDKTIDEIEEKLPANYKKFVNDMMEYYDKDVYPRLNQVFKQAFKTDANLERVSNYLPLNNILANNTKTEVMADVLMRNGFDNVSLDRSHTYARVKSGTPFARMDFFGSIFKATKTNEHWIAFEPTREKVMGVLNNQELKGAISEKNTWAYKEINNWVGAVMRGRIKNDENAINKLSDSARHFYMSTALGMNLVTMLKQPASFFVGAQKIAEGGSGIDIASGLADFIFRPDKIGELHKFIKENSVLMRNRGKNLGFEFAEIAEGKAFNDMFTTEALKEALSPSVLKKKFDANGFQGFGRKLRDISMLGIRLFDRVTTDVLWHTKYKQGVNKHGDHARAVEEADEVIRTTQPMGGLIDVNSLRRSKGLARSMTVFTEQLTQNYNLAREAMGEAGDVKLTTTASRAMILGVISPAMIYMASNGVLPGMDRWDSKRWIEYMFQNVFGGIPFFNYISDTVIKKGLNIRREFTGEEPSKTFGESNIATEWMNDVEKLLNKGMEAEFTDYYSVASKVAGVPGAVSQKRIFKGIGKFDEVLESEGVVRATAGIFWSDAALADVSRKAYMAKTLAGEGTRERKLVFMRSWLSMTDDEKVAFEEYAEREHGLENVSIEAEGLITDLVGTAAEAGKVQSAKTAFRKLVAQEERKERPSQSKIERHEKEMEEEIQKIEEDFDKLREVQDELESQ